MRLEIHGEYPSNWPEISAEAKVRAGHRCARCRHPFDPTTGRPLPCDDRCDQTRGRNTRSRRTHDHGLNPASPDLGFNFGVHHLDGDKGNCRWWNLLASCNTCHLDAVAIVSVQARVILERPWLFDHSEWFMPYVCGFYASYYGGIEITPAEAARDPQRWLALNPAIADVSGDASRVLTGAAV